MLRKIINRLIKYTRKNKTEMFFLFLILVIGFILRVYNINSLLGFYYDQGRDALKIWDLWHKADIFLVGPTTGIAGILRGPYYYYLISPLYLISGGNPVWASVFISSTTVVSIYFMYYLGSKIHGKVTGFIAAITAAFSFNLVLASRWLSEVTPMMLLSVLLIWMMLLVTEGKKWAWVGISLVSGLSLFHFGPTAGLFYFLAIFVFAIWQKKNLPNKKTLKYSLAALLFTVLPLIIFDIRNNWLILKNIQAFLFKDESFRLVTWREIYDRFDFYYDAFTKLIFHGSPYKEKLVLTGVFLYFTYRLKDLWKLRGVKILLLLLGSLVAGFTFFQGNFGNIYDYYLTGYFLVFVLLFSISLGEMYKSKLGKLFLIFFFVTFFSNNAEVLRYKFTDNADGPNSIAFKNQLEATNWIFDDAKEKEHNVDVYVPPVIPYAYDYLLLWQGTLRHAQGKCERDLCGLELDKMTDVLYTLFEHDPPHPERLQAWLDRQEGIGEIEEEVSFGAITIQRRKRILYE